MGLIHTPRVVASICKGLWKRRGLLRSSQIPPALDRITNINTTTNTTTTTNNNNSSFVGMGPQHVHTYYARAGLLDVDYLGHMNNASYLAHAELARWEWCATNGLLPVMMMQGGVHFVVAGAQIRYRKELRPLWTRFQIDTHVCGLDDRTIWISQKFRYAHHSRRVLAQMMVQGVAIQEGNYVLNPCDFFTERVGVPKEMVEALRLPHQTTNNGTPNTNMMMMIIEKYRDLDQALKEDASFDDQEQQRK